MTAVEKEWYRSSSGSRRQVGARKAAATRKQKSASQSIDKVSTAGNEFWCLCGDPESGNMIACDNPGCPIHISGTISNALDLWMHQVESGFELNVLFNIFNYRIYSNKRRGAYSIFRATSAGLI